MANVITFPDPGDPSKADQDSAAQAVQNAGPSFILDGRGKTVANAANVAALLRTEAIGRFAYDVVTRAITRDGQPLDADYLAVDVLVAIQKHREGGRNPFARVGRDTVADAVLMAAHANEFNSAAAWLESLPPWDRVERIPHWLPDNFGTADDDYHRSVSDYFWMAMTRRMLTPGERADMMPVLIGRQGIGKADALRAVAAERYVTTSLHNAGDKEFFLRLRGALIVEVAELAGLRRADMERVKAVVTETHDTYRVPYGRCAERVPRSFVFVGTANEGGFLTDGTGNRRWLPVQCATVNVENIRGTRDQCFAEALHRVRSGIAGDFWNVAGAQEAQAAELEPDSWRDVLAERLERTRPHLVTVRWCEDVLGLRIAEANSGHWRRISKAMKGLGWWPAKWEKRRGYVLVGSPLLTHIPDNLEPLNITGDEAKDAEDAPATMT